MVTGKNTIKIKFKKRNISLTCPCTYNYLTPLYFNISRRYASHCSYRGPVPWYTVNLDLPPYKRWHDLLTVKASSVSCDSSRFCS